MSKIIINRDSDTVLTTYFKEHEFFCKCPDYKSNNHLLDHELIRAAQIIREFINTPVLINSSYRTLKCNAAQGGSKNSYHLKGMALDISCPLSFDFVKWSVSQCGHLYHALRKTGINGFGISSSFLHIDTRPYGAVSDADGKYDLWYY